MSARSCTDHLARLAFLFCLALPGCNGCGPSQGTSGSSSSSSGGPAAGDGGLAPEDSGLEPGLQEAANDALEELRKLATPEVLRDLGFFSPAEVGQTFLGPPIPVRFARLDTLAAYRPGDAPNKIFAPIQQAIFPVYTRGGPDTDRLPDRARPDGLRSSIAMAHSGGKWKAAAYGRPAMILLLQARRAQLGKLVRKAPDSTFVVQVPALNASFAGSIDEGRMKLLPVQEDVDLGLKDGEVVDANDVLAKLAAAARGHDGLPR